MKGIRLALSSVVAILLASMIAAAARADDVNWESATTGGAVSGRVLSPPRPDPARPVATVIYLKNLSVPRIGQDTDDAIVADLLAGGHLVLVLDYARHAGAASPGLNADVLKLREDVAKHRLLGDRNVDLAHLFILAEGFRLRRDLEFARDGSRVLAMDVQYPGRPGRAVPALMEITCDNVNRMGTGSLLFCRDTLLDGAQFAGFAVAMVDHPVAPPYKGIDDPMPECIWRLKAAVRTLRATGAEIGLSGNVGAVGFSRGSEMAGFLAATGGRADLDGDDPARPNVSSRVQAALVHGARFDLTVIDSDDPMYARFEKAWGPRDRDPGRWALHGVSHYLTPDAAPMYLNTSDAEAPEFRGGLALFAKRLKELGVEHVYQEDKDGRGHRVSTDAATLASIYRFFHRHLDRRPNDPGQ